MEATGRKLSEGRPAAFAQRDDLLRSPLILQLDGGCMFLHGAGSQRRQLVRCRKGHQLKAQKLAVVVLRIYNRPAHITPVHRIAVVGEGVQSFCRRTAEEQQRSQPKGAEDMKNASTLR